MIAANDEVAAPHVLTAERCEHSFTRSCVTGISEKASQYDPASGITTKLEQRLIAEHDRLRQKIARLLWSDDGVDVDAIRPRPLQGLQLDELMPAMSRVSGMETDHLRPAQAGEDETGL